MQINIDLSGKIVMAFTDPVDTDPPETRYRYFTEYFTGEGVHMYCIFNTPEDFVSKWLKIHDKPNGMWYWVLDDGECICSGACDPNDIEIFKRHWPELFKEKHTCLTCAHYEYLHEYEEYICSAREYPLHEEIVACLGKCSRYEEYREEMMHKERAP